MIRFKIRALKKRLQEWEKQRERKKRLEAVATGLRPLTPEYDPEAHGFYLTALKDALNDSDIRNIALSGGYGTGKSSILQKLIEDSDGTAISVSFSQLAAQTGDPGSEEGPGPAGTNAIEREIVKQLLYRQKAGKSSTTAFARVVRFHPVRTFGLSLLCGCLLALLVAIPLRLEVTAFPTYWTLIALALLASGLVFILLRFAHNRVAVRSFSAAGASLTVGTATEESYFDKYLDHIVLFFATTPVRTVAFEDLDRLGTPGIFDALRELNTLLNSSKDIGEGPVRFIYAVRDGIFTQDTDPEDAESLRERATSRVKFFDLIISVMPFMSPQVSWQLFQRELCPSTGKNPSDDALRAVQPFLTDMRLVKAVRNDYSVFQAKMKAEFISDEKDRDKLLGIAVYKNLRPADFERIANGTSLLDRLYEEFRHAVRDSVDRLDADAQKLRNGTLTETKRQRLAKEYASRLKVLALPSPQGQPVPLIQCSDGAKKWEEINQPRFWDDLGNEQFKILSSNFFSGTNQQLPASRIEELLDLPLQEQWGPDNSKTLESETGTVQVERLKIIRSTLSGYVFSEDPSFHPKAVGPESVRDRVRQDPLLGALISEGLIDDYYSVYSAEYNGALSKSALNYVIHNVVPDVQDAAYEFESPRRDIEQVFDNQGERFTAGQAFLNYQVFDHFRIHHRDTGEEPSARGARGPMIRSSAVDNAVKRVTAPVEERLRGGEDQGKIVRDSENSDFQFIQDYLDHCCARPGVTGLDYEAIFHFAPLWPAVLEYTLERVAFLDTPTDKQAGSRVLSPLLLQMAGTRARESLMYFRPSLDVIQMLEEYLSSLDCLTRETGVNADDCASLAELLEYLGVRLPELAKVGQHQFDAVVTRGLWQITRDNLDAIDERLGLAGSLNEYASTRKATVLNRLIMNPESVREYIEILKADPTRQVLDLGQDNSVEILCKISSTCALEEASEDEDYDEASLDDERLPELLRHIVSGTRFNSLIWKQDHGEVEGLDEVCLKALLDSDLFIKPTVSNLRYIQKFSTVGKEPLAQYLVRLAEAGETIVTDEGSDSDQTKELSLDVVKLLSTSQGKRADASQPTWKDQGAHAASLLSDLGILLDCSVVEPDSAIPDLVQAGVVLDDEDTYQRLAHSDPATKMRLCEVSNTLTENVEALALSVADLSGLGFMAVKDRVLDALIVLMTEDPDSEALVGEPGLAGLVAERWCARLSDPDGHDSDFKLPLATVDAFCSIAEQMAEDSIRTVLSLLTRVSAGWDAQQLRAAVESLPGKYASILDKRKIEIPAWGTEEQLVRTLKRCGVNRMYPHKSGTFTLGLRSR